jgi:hypothetical protein
MSKGLVFLCIGRDDFLLLCLVQGRPSQSHHNWNKLLKHFQTFLTGPLPYTYFDPITKTCVCLCVCACAHACVCLLHCKLNGWNLTCRVISCNRKPLGSACICLEASFWSCYQERERKTNDGDTSSSGLRSLHNMPVQTQKGFAGTAPSHSQPSTRNRWVVSGQHHAPAALLPGKTHYLLFNRLNRARGWSEQHGICRIYRDLIPGFARS